jgi:hypothetical protein
MLPHPYSSGDGGLTQAPAANFVVKKESVYSSWHTSQKGKNTITSGGSSSAWMTQPGYSSGIGRSCGLGSKQNLLFSRGTGWGSGAAGSSIRYKDEPYAPLVAAFADGKFTQNDINKIMVEKKLRDIVLTDPKKVRMYYILQCIH